MKLLGTTATAGLVIATPVALARVVTAFKESRLLPAMPLIVLLPLAGHLWGEPGGYSLAVFIGYVCLVLAGGIEIQARMSRRATPEPVMTSRSEGRGREEWFDSARRLEAVIAMLSEPIGAETLNSRSGTLH